MILRFTALLENRHDSYRYLRVVLLLCRIIKCTAGCVDNKVTFDIFQKIVSIVFPYFPAFASNISRNVDLWHTDVFRSKLEAKEEIVE